MTDGLDGKTISWATPIEEIWLHVDRRDGHLHGSALIGLVYQTDQGPIEDFAAHPAAGARLTYKRIEP